MNPDGSLHWLEINTQQAKLAQDFYVNLFGWQSYTLHSIPFGMMPILKSDDVEIANIFMAMGGFVQSKWLTFLKGDVDTIGEKVRKAGGHADDNVNNIKGWSRMLGIKDSQGTSTTIIQFEDGRDYDEAGPGQPYFVELWVPDGEAASEFYQQVFDADIEKKDDRWILKKDDSLLFSVITNEAGDFEQRWIPYFRSNAVGADIRRTQLFSGVVQVQQKQVDGLGDMAIVGDPLGAYFGFINPKQ